MNRPRIFISYCHSSQAHKSRCLDLSNRLRSEGVESYIDLYENEGPIQGWVQWMYEQVRKADCVLIVCDEKYQTKLTEDASTHSGSGVVFESYMALQQMYVDRLNNRKYIPVVFTETDREYVPLPLKGYQCFNVSDALEYELMYRRITGQPSISAPSIGDLKEMEEWGGLPEDEDDSIGILVKEEVDRSILIDTDTVYVEINIRGEYERFSYTDLQHLLNALAEMLKIENGTVVVKRIKPGSIDVLLEMPQQVALDLVWEYKEGNLEELGVRSAVIRKRASQERAIFQKCERFFDPDALYSQVKEADLYPYFRPVEKVYGSRVVMQGREVIMAGSNNYLGLTTDPRVIEASNQASIKYGTGCTGSRFLSGTLDLHLELEERLAEFMGTESCVLFSTGYMTNQGVLQSLASKGDIIFSDKDNHACIVAGTKVSMAETIRFRHNDMEHLNRLMERADKEYPDSGKLIVSDGVFSMSGVLAQVPRLAELAEEYGAALMIDDAHAIGVIGPGGRGSAAHFGIPDKVQVTTGTFSKSFASIGGFAVGDRKVIEYIRHTSSAHIFSAAMTPGSVATVLATLEIIQTEPERIAELHRKTEYMRKGFKSLGFNILKSNTPIVPVVASTMRTCLEMWKDLLDEGVYVNAVVPPAVPQGQSLLRTSYMASHSDDDLDSILEAFTRVGRNHKII